MKHGYEKQNAVSKQNVIVYTNKTQEEFKKIGQEMYQNNSKVKSAMCSGIQWDLVMKFIDGKNDGQGNTYNVEESNKLRHIDDGKTKTGKNINDKVQNIYDLEGNCWEYTAEKIKIENEFKFIIRGGYYSSAYRVREASKRSYGDGDKYEATTFRTVLYIM